MIKKPGETKHQEKQIMGMPFLLLMTGFFLTLFSSSLFAEKDKNTLSEDNMGIELSAMFSDNMVLQRGMEIPVWGWAAPGATVTVSLADRKVSAETGANGKWMVRLRPLPAGGPHSLIVKSKGDVLEMKNILIGDVWLASGQSNMEWPLWATENAEEAIAEANWPNIRLITVPHQVWNEPRERVNTTGWVECTSETVRHFSAVAYYFGRDLHNKLDVPIGLVNSSWGGSAMEAWTPLEVMDGDPDFEEVMQFYCEWKDRFDWLYEDNHFEQALSRWKEQTGGGGAHKDPGFQPLTKSWSDPDYDDSEWPVMAIPNHWEMLEEYQLMDGVVWHRKEIELPESWAGKDLELRLGLIADTDRTFFNGVMVGKQPKLDSWWSNREYSVEGQLVRAGKNVIAIRVFDGSGPGGILGPKENLYLSLKDDSESKIPLDGKWKLKAAVRLQQNPTVPGRNDHGTPSLLYNAMIHPLIPYGIKGVIWYQGESNCARAADYLKLSKLMIREWRDRWNQGNFPFLVTQLAGFDVDWTGWLEVQEAQLQTVEDVPNTAVAVTIDIGDAKDIHPKNKLDVGKRLALAARAIAYDDDEVVYSGPVYHSMEVEGNEARLHFDHIGSGLMSPGDSGLGGFEIAGEKGDYVKAQAEIQDETVLVYSEEVKNPVSVRYAWKNYPEEANLFNKEGLPASPFRTKTH